MRRKIFMAACVSMLLMAVVSGCGDKAGAGKQEHSSAGNAAAKSMGDTVEDVTDGDSGMGITDAEGRILQTDPGLVLRQGDKIIINYTASVDGEEFDSVEDGMEIELGADALFNGFDRQLIGYHPGDEVHVQVSLPEDFENPDVAGKEAVYSVIINGILQDVDPSLETMADPSLDPQFSVDVPGGVETSMEEAPVE